MNSFKKLLKKSKIYNFFSYNFNLIKYKINQLELENNNIFKEILLLKESLNNLQNSKEIKLLDERMKQFDCINTELLLLSNNEDKLKVLIVGFYGAPNSGDELMLQSILEKIDTSKYSITIMLADNPNYKIDNYRNVKFIHYPKTNMDFNIIANYFDKVIFGGGALLEDAYFSEDNSYKYSTAAILINLSLACIMHDKPFYCIGLSSANAFTNMEYLSKLDFIISKAKHFSLRDTNSIKTLQEAGIKNIDKIRIVDDLVFSLKDIHYNISNKLDDDNFVLGLVLIGFSDNNKLKEILIWIDEYFKNINKSLKIKLIPFYDYKHSDIYNLTNITNNIKINSSIEITQYYQQYEDIMNIFNSCNLIINMRYHSTLLCLKAGIPAINIIYDIHSHYINKMSFLRETYSINNLFLSYKELNKEHLEDSLNFVINNIKQINIIESRISKQIYERAVKTHTEIINNILEN